MYNWTDEQLEAVNAYGSPVIVSAAAGSGKTAVLVERTIRLLCDKELAIPADRLLAVTFTNDAASQMSQKLSQAIDARAELEPDNEWIQRQQVLLRLADITTINSFCYNLVKDNLSDTDFQSGIRILEENEADMLTDRALTAVMEREYSERPQETEELISLFCRENDSSLRRMILQLYRFLRSLPFSEVWTENVLRSLRDGSVVKAVFDELDSRARETLGLISGAAERLRRCAESLEYHSAAKAVLLDNCALALDTAEKISRAERSEVAALASEVEWKALRVRQTKAEKECCSQLEEGLYESARSCNNHLKSLFEELSQIYIYTEDETAADAEKTAVYFAELVRLCNLLDDETHRLKVERNAVDFADTELMSVRLLASCGSDGKIVRTPLAEEMIRNQRYKVILIDEFQDVNNLQEVIFKAISSGDNTDEIGSNVFAVGDVKQAIYRFRLANPQIFMRTRAQGKSPESPVREILLRRNFRSRGGVLKFCNYVFGALMSRRVGETDYTSEEALVKGAEFDGSDAPTEIIAVNSDTADGADLEFTAIARRIRHLIDEKTPVKDENGVRPCKPSDFCVLSRNNIAGSDISEIFASEGLKVLTSDTSGYLKSREISLLLNLLALISNPMQDIPLVSVMLSPIFGFSDDDVAALRLFSRSDKLYKVMLAVSVGEYDAAEELRKKCADAVALLKRLSVYASGLTLTRLIRKIYDITDIFAAASAYEDGAQKCANLYLLLEYARSYEQSSPDGIAGFLRYIDYISASGGDFEQALTVTEPEDSVVIKTIHRSKGLEYPFVFLCRTSKRFNRTDLNGLMQLNNEKGVGLGFLDYSTLTKRKTAIWEYLRRANTEEMLSEELRLLYVALTRAKERLFIVLDLNEKAVKRASELSFEIDGYRVPPSVACKATCLADWLMSALMKHPDFGALRSRLDGGIYTDSGDILPDISVTSMPERSTSEATSEGEKAAVADEALAAFLKESFALRTDGILTESEAKLTVTEVVKEDALSFFPQVPSLGESLEEISAARRGTITHRFMQFCNFKASSESVEPEIERLRLAGVFTAQEAAAIDRRAVMRFFESGVYVRLSRSKNVLREKQFIVRFDDIKVDGSLREKYGSTDGMLQGIADCLFEEDDGYVLVDYKTDRVKSPEELVEKYRGQLELYKAAFDVLLDKPVKSSFIYSFRLGEGIELKA